MLCFLSVLPLPYSCISFLTSLDSLFYYSVISISLIVTYFYNPFGPLLEITVCVLYLYKLNVTFWLLSPQHLLQTPSTSQPRRHHFQKPQALPQIQTHLSPALSSPT